MAVETEPSSERAQAQIKGVSKYKVKYIQSNYLLNVTSHTVRYV